MVERELRREMAVLPIGVVRELTGLSDRQIRYYDQQKLITPQRGNGKQRRYSLKDVDRLFEIADYLDLGYSIADIHEMDQKKAATERQNGDAAMRRAFADELMRIGRFNNHNSFRQ
ncbi:glutamine synthetase repressor [Weissella oryzae SG25]|uniref:Glutamine synthetase repressor n=1 Tax=Weissella oryzae (strain DSM 25784 / JCM 18191 / LMG 30913 / SG25) TaxID=1329250 RepID=A0A069D2W0_WEIOS|nr:MerR family transcriptional regulator [Weissella oryzae]GAK31741.1 glutamine synthetase repressor [Weissella oryzae SG25]